MWCATAVLYIIGIPRSMTAHTTSICLWWVTKSNPKPKIINSRSRKYYRCYSLLHFPPTTQSHSHWKFKFYSLSIRFPLYYSLSSLFQVNQIPHRHWSLVLKHVLKSNYWCPYQINNKKNSNILKEFGTTIYKFRFLCVYVSNL